jgi:hypothetical protein
MSEFHFAMLHHFLEQRHVSVTERACIELSIEFLNAFASIWPIPAMDISQLMSYITLHMTKHVSLYGFYPGLNTMARVDATLD